MTSDRTVDDSKLDQIFDEMSPSSRASAMRGLASVPDSEARDVFKRLGDAVYDSKQDQASRHVRGVKGREFHEVRGREL
jgi:triphosphoribosyl-dephospho-CoA synthetase